MTFCGFQKAPMVSAKVQLFANYSGVGGKIMHVAQSTILRLNVQQVRVDTVDIQRLRH